MFAKSQAHLILIIAGTVLSAFSLGSVIRFTDPYSAGVLTHFFFYASLFMTTLGMFTAFGIALRQRFTEGLYISHLSAAFRQALLISLLIIISFLLLSRGLMFWWIEIILLLFFVALEIFLNLK